MMGCQACEMFQIGQLTSWFRWKNANVEIRACPEHLQEIFAVLRLALQVEAAFPFQHYRYVFPNAQGHSFFACVDNEVICQLCGGHKGNHE